MRNQLSGTGWDVALRDALNSSWYKNLLKEVQQQRKYNQVFPPEKDVFRAYQLTHFEDVKVVIIGQDPYHGEGQANGLAFSVHRGIKIPPSLRNIYKELAANTDFFIPSHGDLTTWAEQGVLMINSVLTVNEGHPGSHKNVGWQQFTDEAISSLSHNRQGLIFLLWGNYAIEKEKLINVEKHHVLKAMHPSPLSAYRGFFGCKHFSKVNHILVKQHKKPVDWQLPF